MKLKKGTNFNVSDSSLDRFGNALEIDSCLIPAGGQPFASSIPAVNSSPAHQSYFPLQVPWTPPPPWTPPHDSLLQDGFLAPTLVGEHEAENALNSPTETGPKKITNFDRTQPIAVITS
jgi:hypothetical protein